MFKFKRKFQTNIYMKSGNVISFPYGFFSEFTVQRERNVVTQLSWKINSDRGQILDIQLDEIEAIVTKY